MVAADLLRSVAVAPTLDNVLVLGLIVAIRMFLSFSLETEIEGVAPWRGALENSGSPEVSGNDLEGLSGSFGPGVFARPLTPFCRRAAAVSVATGRLEVASAFEASLSVTRAG